MEAWGHLIQENKRGAPLVTEERGERERERLTLPGRSALSGILPHFWKKKMVRSRGGRKEETGGDRRRKEEKKGEERRRKEKEEEEEQQEEK